MRQHANLVPRLVIWSAEKQYKAQIYDIMKIGSIMTNLFGSITLHKMKLQTCHLHRIKAHGCGHVISSREIIPIERSRAETDQRCPDHTFLRMRRWANTLLTGITLRQYRSLLYELLMAPGNVFQHCASARKFGARIHDLECGEAISSPNIIIS